MLAVVGTVPDINFPLTHGTIQWGNHQLRIDHQTIQINRGTPALLAAAVKASESINGPDIYAFLVGDIGKGDGSRALYQFLVQRLHDFEFKSLTFHYLQPDVDWHNQILFAIEKMKSRPILIADAGYMYAAKMSGQSACYDLFTPDAGEMAFLADEIAPHPFYTRGFILHQDKSEIELIKRAYQFQNASRYLLVKGKKDHIADMNNIIDIIDQPSIEVMEAIGGTGDTLTGILSVLSSLNYGHVQSSIIAARANRWMGYYANACPATQISELIETIPRALSTVFGQMNVRSSVMN